MAELREMVTRSVLMQAVASVGLGVFQTVEYAAEKAASSGSSF